ncbi:transcription repressor NadR [Salipaludibacillus sp. CUR1]|uniref:transcription repressor NadR n=1 Tax=Salipaludibacillus sp. CUR1 TaxID=2820003 RepID=UPI001E570E12|nr:transcription repressor NadR [Salipaludibacillus sp. CUR1]MCE7793688.1 transcription repressor NadR [Salipaludibacillus sp. CUR1]
MLKNRKWLGDERRNEILTLLKNTGTPITGGELADRMNVSRQVIVQDISLLKAKNYPVMATSQGYILTENNDTGEGIKRIVACYHGPEQTEEELLLLVDQGVRVNDVKVEHPIYGDITASIMVSNRKEVYQFLKKMERTKASYLSELTGGVHLHTIEANSEKDLDDAVDALNEAGFLLTGEPRH